MSQVRWVTPGFAVAPQPQVEEIEALRAAGFKTLIGNRPDGEEPGQPSRAELAAAAATAGLAFHSLPFSGRPTPQLAAEFGRLLDQAPQPVLAFCRTGTRSIGAWALAQARAGNLSTVEILAAATAAGYDLSGMREAIDGSRA